MGWVSDHALYKTKTGGALAEMSHRILKSSMTEPRGLLSDVSCMAESYWCWARNALAESSSSWIWQNKKGKGSSSSEWSISEFRTDQNLRVLNGDRDDYYYYYYNDPKNHVDDDGPV